MGRAAGAGLTSNWQIGQPAVSQGLRNWLDSPLECTDVEVPRATAESRNYKSEYLGLRHGATSESFACKRALRGFRGSLF